MPEASSVALGGLLMALAEQMKENILPMQDLSSHGRGVSKLLLKERRLGDFGRRREG